MNYFDYKQGDLIRRESSMIPQWYWWYLVIDSTNFGINVLNLKTGNHLVIGFDILDHYEIASRPE